MAPRGRNGHDGSRPFGTTRLGRPVRAEGSRSHEDSGRRGGAVELIWTAVCSRRLLDRRVRDRSAGIGDCPAEPGELASDSDRDDLRRSRRSLSSRRQVRCRRCWALEESATTSAAGLVGVAQCRDLRWCLAVRGRLDQQPSDVTGIGLRGSSLATELAAAVLAGHDTEELVGCPRSFWRVRNLRRPGSEPRSCTASLTRQDS
jgi:hypothetical protein